MSYITANNEAAPALASDLSQAFQYEVGEFTKFTPHRSSIFNGLMWAVSIGICFWIAVAMVIKSL